MKLETLQAYRYMITKYGPGKAAHLMRLTPKEAQVALKILTIRDTQEKYEPEEEGEEDW